MSKLQVAIMIVATCISCGCASNRALIKSDHLHIKKIPSDNMQFGYIYVGDENGKTEIYGSARFNNRILGIPSDHLLVTIIDPDGKELYSVRSQYYHNGKLERQSDMFSFLITIPDLIPKGSTIQLEDEKP